MRLDHLLSKESDAGQTGSVPVDRCNESGLFNFEGPERETSRSIEVQAKPETGNRGGIAQLGEHLLCKQRVKGSNPFISTRYGLIAQLVRALG